MTADATSVLSSLNDMKKSFGEEAVKDIVETFVSSTEDLLDRLDGAVTSQDAAQLKAAAHELKGACASVGANEMSKMCAEIEMMGRENQLATARDALLQLADLFNQVKRSLSNYH
jgi:HPt (histidine-containing phosphotransfer) domain-containing protein